jgi:TnpA family transposase
MAYLLGIDLMPRIRNLRDLSLSRPDPGAPYRNLQPLFGDGAIDWDLIQTHLPDMLRVAVSIKTGKITASTILRRLGTASRKNKLYFAFRELGRVVRTMFLLRYIDSAEIRHMITAATTKSEEFNNFTQWAFFGGQGIIAQNLRHEQEKIIGYNHLVANMVILHNVEHMSRVITQLQADGHTFTPKSLPAYRLIARRKSIGLVTTPLISRGRFFRTMWGVACLCPRSPMRPSRAKRRRNQRWSEGTRRRRASLQPPWHRGSRH